MADKEFNPYAGTTGLKSDFIGTVTDESEFTYDNEYAAGAVVAKLYIVDEADGEEISQLYSTGKKVEPSADGKEVEREDGSEMRGFNRQTNWQRLIDHLYTTAGGDAYMDGSDETLPWQISVVVGLKARWDFIQYKNMDGEEKDLLVPVEVIEVPGGGKAAKKAPAKPAARAKKEEEPDAEEKEDAAPSAADKAAAAKAKAAAAKAKAKGDEGTGDASLDQIIAIAKEADSHDEFMQKVFEDVADADAYEDQIVDEAFYDTHHG